MTCRYCGPNASIPPGYDRRGSPYECLRSGIGVGKYGERRVWQRRSGLPVDPEYVSPCGENRVYAQRQTSLRSSRNNPSRRRSNRNNSARRIPRTNRSNRNNPSRSSSRNSSNRSRRNRSRSRAPSRSPRYSHRSYKRSSSPSWY